MRTVIRRSGNGAAVHIPAPVMRAARLRVGQQVDVREIDGGVLIEPVQPASYDLGSLLEGIIGDNLHGEITTGDAVGREMW